MNALMDPARIKDAMCMLREDGERNLKSSRHSFIRTPANLAARFLNQLHPEQQPLTTFDLLKISIFLLWRIHLTFMSLLVIYAISLGIAGLGNMTYNGWRMARPPEDQVRAITTALGIFHLTMVGTLSLLWGFELPISYPMLLVYSIAGIVATFVCGVFGGTVLVAAWKMLRGTWKRMYWPPSGSHGAVVEVEKDEQSLLAAPENTREWCANEMPRNPSLLDGNGYVRNEFIDVPDQAG